jgi:hypothetical protein
VVTPISGSAVSKVYILRWQLIYELYDDQSSSCEENSSCSKSSIQNLRPRLFHSEPRTLVAFIHTRGKNEIERETINTRKQHSYGNGLWYYVLCITHFLGDWATSSYLVMVQLVQRISSSTLYYTNIPPIGADIPIYLPSRFFYQVGLACGKYHL